MKAAVIAIWLASLLAAGAAVAAEPPPGAVITNPDWITRPSGDDVNAAYPKLAGLLLIPGKAAIRCEVTPAGALAACSASAESPKGLGFAAAALSLAPTFRIRPKMVDGRPVEGGVVTIPLNFTAEPARRDIASRMELRPKPEMLALATQAVDYVWIVEAFATRARGQMRDALAGSDGETAPDVRDRGIEAYQSTLEAALPGLRDQFARILATRLDEAELRELLALPRPEAADRLFQHQERFEQAAMHLIDDATDHLQDDARARFCKVQDCAITPLVYPHEE